MRFLFSFFSPPHRFYVSLPPRRKDEDTQRSNFNRKIVNRKIVNITMILFFRTPSKSVIAVECNHEPPRQTATNSAGFLEKPPPKVKTT